MAKVSIQGIRKQFGTTVAISEVSLEIAEGELMTFLGPSGCGKTTTLRVIAGFITPTKGRVLIGETDVTRLPVHKRDTGMVFQRYALFPHMTVSENVNFGLQMHQVPKGDRQARIAQVLDMVQMTALRDRYPRQLSGGQQQRVAIARALAIEPKVFLLDEPLSNLDAKLRLEVREEIRSLQQRLALTTIFVTHDQEEAMAIADRMAIMHDGVVQQVGAPHRLYEHPANRFVADFLGKMNVFKGRALADGLFQTDGGAGIVASGCTGALQVGVRPERVRLHEQPVGANALAGVVESSLYLGSVLEVRAKLDGGERVVSQVVNGSAGRAHLAPGSRIHACFAPEDCMAFTQ